MGQGGEINKSVCEKQREITHLQTHYKKATRAREEANSEDLCSQLKDGCVDWVMGGEERRWGTHNSRHFF